jgi:hypothetical protein
MDNETAMKRVVDGVVGKTMQFKLMSSGKVEIVIKKVRDLGGNLIFDGETLSVGFFTPIAVFSLVKKETEKGWEVEQILDEVLINGTPALEVFRLLVAD